MAAGSEEAKCSKCQKTFKNLREYFKHRSRQCKPKRCPICLQVFYQARNLYAHTHKQKKHNCDHCNRTFCDEATYQRHLRSLRDITDHDIHNLDQRIYPETGYENEDGYQEVIENKFNEIRDRIKNN